MCKSDVQRLVVSHAVDEPGAASGNFTVTAPSPGYRVVHAHLAVEGALASVLTAEQHYLLRTADVDGNASPYVNKVQFNYTVSNGATVIGEVIFERSDEPDVAVTQ